MYISEAENRILIILDDSNFLSSKFNAANNWMGSNFIHPLYPKDVANHTQPLSLPIRPSCDSLLLLRMVIEASDSIAALSFATLVTKRYVQPKLVRPPRERIGFRKDGDRGG